MNRATAIALVDDYADAETDLATYVRTYRGIDLLGDPEYIRLSAARDNARNALVAALTRGAS